MKLSKNAAGLAMLVVTVLGLFGVDVEIETTTDAILALGAVVSFIMMVWNQFNRPDVSGFFFKK